jgi:hypothetical protein
MKAFMILLLLGFFTEAASSQATARVYDMNYLKNKVAEINKVPATNVKSVEVRTAGSTSFVYAKLTVNNNPVTFAQELGSGGGSIPPFIKGSVTCAGVGCQECDIENFPDILNAWCNCKRSVDSGGYCNMTKSIGF